MDENTHSQKYAIRIQLPRAIAGWIPVRPWIQTKVGATSSIRMGRNRVPIELHSVPASMTAELAAEVAPSLTAQRKTRLNVVVSPLLRKSVRDLLEGQGISYADSKGHVHLAWAGLLVHIDAEAPAVALRRPDGLGPSGVRAVQALLLADGPVQLSQLSAQVQLSLSQTHSVFTQLENAGLMRSTGSGPSRRRVVVDRTQLLDWLAAQATARRRETRLDVALYARRPEELWRRIATRFGESGTAYAVTGAAGAALLGVGPTAVPLSTVRITPDVSLANAARTLGAEPVERGPNLRLIRDTGEVGCVGAERLDGILVAPKVRVYLDTLSDKRGEDLAEQFREVILGY